MNLAQRNTTKVRFNLLFRIISGFLSLLFIISNKDARAQTESPNTTETEIESEIETEKAKNNSDLFFKEFLQDTGVIFPALAYSNGLEKYKGKTPNFKYELNETTLYKLREWILKCVEAESRATNQLEKLDYSLMRVALTQTADQLNEIHFGRKVVVVSPAAVIWTSISPYLENKKDTEIAIQIIKKFANGDLSSFAVFPYFEGILRRKMANVDLKSLIFPLQNDVQKTMDEQANFLEQIRNTLRKNGIEDKVTEEISRLERQYKDWHHYVRDFVLPHSKKGIHLSREEYRFRLREQSIYLNPEEVLEASKKDLTKLRNQILEILATMQSSRPKKDNPSEIKSMLELLTRQKIKSRQIFNQHAEKSIKRLTGDFINLRPTKFLSKPENKPQNWVQNAGFTELQFFPVSILEKETKKNIIVAPEIGPTVRQNQDFLFLDALPMSIAREIFPGKRYLQEKILESRSSMIQKNYSYRMPLFQGWGLFALEASLYHLNPSERFSAMLYLLVKTLLAYFDSAIHLGQENPSKLFYELNSNLGISAPTAIFLQNLVTQSPGSMTVDYAGWNILKTQLESFESCQTAIFLSNPLLPILPSKALEEVLTCK